jgi:hypothetical protein
MNNPKCHDMKWELRFATDFKGACCLKHLPIFEDACFPLSANSKRDYENAKKENCPHCPRVASEHPLFLDCGKEK